jgi:hypothetical protein
MARRRVSVLRYTYVACHITMNRELTRICFLEYKSGRSLLLGVLAQMHIWDLASC